MNEAGEVTSHLQGMWYRTIRFIEGGIKPVFVFDGKPPTLKGGELAKRSAAKQKATDALAAATEANNVEDMERFAKRTVKMDKTHIDDCKKLLRLMGMPVVEAPCEAEAQCAALAKADKVYAAASEDMDTLTFGAPRLIRRMWASEAQKLPLMEINLAKAIDGLGLTMDQFVDVCILSGCDYCDGIKGVASTTAYKLIKAHGSLKAAIATIESEKMPVGVDYDAVKQLFTHPDVADPSTIELKWGDPDEAGLKEFLVDGKGFQLARIEGGLAKLKKARSTGSQQRMDSFFKILPPAEGSGGAGSKRKAADEAAKGKAAAMKGLKKKAGDGEAMPKKAKKVG
jgi:flap endonuclease-1